MRSRVKREREPSSTGRALVQHSSPAGQRAKAQKRQKPLHSEHGPDSVYLWTLPMFHCNGWCTAWGVTAIGGRHVCLRAVRGERIWQLLEQEKGTHLNGGPPVLTALGSAEEAHPLDRPLVITTAGAPPNPKTIARCEDFNARVVHVYGLTETYGPYSRPAT